MNYKKIVLMSLLLLAIINIGFSTLKDGNIAYWAMDSSTGQLVDSSGNGHSLTNNGATSTTGKLRNGFYFSGNNYLSVPNDLLSSTSPRTISMWIKTTSDMTTGWMYAATRQSGEYHVGFQDHNIRCGLRPNSDNWQYFTISGNYEDSNWHQIVFEWAGPTQKTVKIYADGVLKLTSSYSNPLGGGQYSTRMGQSGAGGWQYTGAIDEVGLWNRALSSTEVSELYNNGNGYNPYAYIPPTINIQNISLINNTYYNTSNINISIQLNTTATNNNTNISYSLNGNAYTQFVLNNLNGTLNLNNLNDGTYNISFYAWNNETNTTSQTYTFTIDTTKPNITIDNISEINVYEINLSKLFSYSDVNLDSCYTVIDNKTNNCSSYTFVQNGEQLIQIYVNDSAGNVAHKNTTIFVNPFVYVYFNASNNTRITNFYINNSLYDSVFKRKVYDYMSTTDTSKNVSFQFKKLGFITSYFTLALNKTSKINKTYVMPYAVINITLRDVETRQYITKPATLKMSGPISFIANTSTGKFEYSNLDMPVGTYTVFAVINGYTSNSAKFTFTNDKQVNVKLYPVNLSSIYFGQILVTVENQFAEALPDATVNLLEYSYDSNSFENVWQGVTNSKGQTLIPVLLTQAKYIIQIVTPVNHLIYSSSTSGEIFFTNGDTRTYQVDTMSTSNVRTNVNNIKFTALENQTALSQNISQIYLSYTDLSNVVSKVCVQYYNSNKQILLNDTKCFTGSSSLGYSNSVPINTSTDDFIVKIYAYKPDNSKTLLKQFVHKSNDSLEHLLVSLSLAKIIVFALFVLAISVMIMSGNIVTGLMSMIAFTFITYILLPSIMLTAAVSTILLVLITLIWVTTR